MIASGEDSPEALSGFVKFHPQYPVLKVPGGACGPPCASRSRLAQDCILPCALGRVKNFFQKVFPGRPAGRGAPRLPGFGPSRRRVRHYTRPRRPGGGKPARTQDADNSSAVKRRWSQAEGGIGLALRPAPHARPPGRPTQPHASSRLYIGRKIGRAFGPGVFRAATQAAPPLSPAFPCSLPPSFSRRG